MNKPTVENISLMYIDRAKKYFLVMTVDTGLDLEHVLIEEGDSELKFQLRKRGEHIANQVGVDFFNEVKEDITISGRGGYLLNR
ncbi:hypothetical protein [Paenibacillus donghaensis]|uniref:Uncharacterized protein n=1 Tax=Paenibacillus donghaensis TaxID=414771 RepID=A0A2Z2KNU2_9BACL|nr:hypothetical protein [Paenibacillus donghaensis]ASA21801.1 hypothetical protein B9T62_14085 [Paenibacillus donghaensis]